MSVQTSYATKFTRGVAGDVVTANPKRVSTKANGTTAVEFGRGLVQSSSDPEQARIPQSGDTAGDLIGISRRDLKVEAPADGSVAVEYPTYSAMGVIEEGDVYVQTEESVSPSDDVYMRVTGKAQVQVITFDADLITGNDTDLKIDGVSMTTVPFNASHTQTMTDLAAQIQTQFSQVTTAVSNAVARTITMTAANTGEDGEFVVSDLAVTGGASQASGVVTESVASVNDSEAGKFRNDSDSSTAVQITNAKFITSTENDVAGLYLK